MKLTTLLFAAVFALLASCSVIHKNYVVVGKRRPYNRILFLDLDNTLYPRSTEFQEEFYKWIPQYYVDGLKMNEFIAHQRYHQYHDQYKSSLKGIYANHSSTGFDVNHYIEYLDKNLDYSKIQPVKGVKEILERVQARLVIVTNSGIRHAERALTCLGIYDLFESIIFSDFHDPEYISKPNPEVYKISMEVTDSAGECTYFFVDDEPKNVSVGGEFGWTTLHFVENSQPSDKVIGHMTHIEQVWPQLFLK